jgi:hypothetical protein
MVSGAQVLSNASAFAVAAAWNTVSVAIVDSASDAWVHPITASLQAAVITTILVIVMHMFLVVEGGVVNTTDEFPPVTLGGGGEAMTQHPPRPAVPFMPKWLDGWRRQPTLAVR